MNIKSFNKVLDSKVRELAIDLHWVAMWAHVEDGNFESAMTSQLLYLVNRDEWIDFTDRFTRRDWDTLNNLHRIMTGMSL